MRAIDYLLKPFTIEEVEECLKKVRQELEKREVDEWSKKMAADQLLETILQTRMDRTLLEKNFRGVFQEEMKTCGFGIAAVYGTLNEDQCAEIQKRWKGIRYIGTKDSVCMLVMSGYMPVKDTAFQIWNTLKEEPKAVGWCMADGRQISCMKKRKCFETAAVPLFTVIRQLCSVSMKRFIRQERSMMQKNNSEDVRKSADW